MKNVTMILSLAFFISLWVVFCTEGGHFWVKAKPVNNIFVYMIWMYAQNN